LRGGKHAWENLVWSDKAANAKKGNRQPEIAAESPSRIGSSAA